MSSDIQSLNSAHYVSSLQCVTGFDYSKNQNLPPYFSGKMPTPRQQNLVASMHGRGKTVPLQTSLSASVKSKSDVTVSACFWGRGWNRLTGAELFYIVVPVRTTKSEEGSPLQIPNLLLCNSAAAASR